MTPEQKARAYDEALVRARKLQENSNGMILKKWLWNIFPELKESKGERIRKALIDFFSKGAENGEQTNDVSDKDILAWLEKQGKQEEPQVYDTGDGEVITYSETEGYKVVEPKFKIKYAGSEYNVFEIKDIAGVIFYGIEDEPNHIDYVQAENCEIIDGYSVKKNGCSFPTKSIIFSEQKSANNEPKFHEGDWVIYNNDICQIVKREEGCNILVTQFGVEKESVNERNLSTAKLWDISDAKNGDVLATDKSVFIYAKVLYGKPYAYCGVDKFGVFKDNCLKYDWANSVDNIHPATKEQRDLLFAKMKEAGCMFDFKNKEFKKIKNEITIPFGAKDSELQEAIYHIPKGFHAEIDDDKVVIKKGEKPTAWMEEDGKRIQRISDFIWKNRKGDTDDIYQQEQDVKWLKSLKGRVGCEANCTTTKEWSKEDEHRVKDTIYFLDTAKKHYASTVELEACIDWLKSLEDRVQPKQEWSAEDNRLLRVCVAAINGIDNFCSENKQELTDWLKFLKQRIGG